MAEGLHGYIVEDSIQGKEVLGLDPIEEKVGLFPCSQGIEYEEGVFSGGWVGKLCEKRGEGGF